MTPCQTEAVPNDTQYPLLTSPNGEELLVQRGACAIAGACVRPRRGMHKPTQRHACNSTASSVKQKTVPPRLSKADSRNPRPEIPTRYTDPRDTRKPLPPPQTGAGGASCIIPRPHASLPKHSFPKGEAGEMGHTDGTLSAVSRYTPYYNTRCNAGCRGQSCPSWSHTRWPGNRGTSGP